MARSRNRIRDFTSKGSAAPSITGTGKLAKLGHFDTATGRVLQHPRIKQNPLTGGSVRVTNPRASLASRAERTASLGMGGVGSVGRTRDVGAPAE